MTQRSAIVTLSALRGRLDAPYVLSDQAASRTVAHWPVVKLGALASRLQYGISTFSGANSVDDGSVPVLGMSNLQDDGWDMRELKYLVPTPQELEKYRLGVGDILVTRTNGSPDLVGKSQVFREPGDWLFASYLIRITVDQARVRPSFLSAFLNSARGRAQVTASARQILQTNVSATELREIDIPLPPLDVQDALLEELGTSHALRDRLLDEADLLMKSFGDVFSDLHPALADLPPAHSTFVVSLASLRHGRIDADAARARSRVAAIAVDTTSLEDIATIDPRPQSEHSDSVPYSGLPECDELNVLRVLERPSSEVASRKAFIEGDLLFARIEPSIFNMKYPLVRGLKVDGPVFTSTEFYIVRSTDPAVAAFLFAALRSPYVQAQIDGLTTGSSGRRRLDRDAFAQLRIPTVASPQLRAIAARTLDRIRALEEKRSRAKEGWATAKLQFDLAVSGAPFDA